MNPYQVPANPDVVTPITRSRGWRAPLLSGGSYASLCLVVFFWIEPIVNGLPGLLAFAVIIAMLPFNLPIMLAMTLGFDSYFIPHLIAGWTTAFAAVTLAHYGLLEFFSQRNSKTRVQPCDAPEWGLRPVSNGQFFSPHPVIATVTRLNVHVHT